jgi:DNA-binding NtrC family response regulator
MWFATDGGGVSYYDGVAWTSLDARDGLAGNCVPSIYQDSDGYLWFATDGGLTRYRRSITSPRAQIISVATDQTYADLDAIPAFTTGTRITIQYNSIDFRTVPEKRQYRCCIYETGDMRHRTSDSGIESQVSNLKSDVPYSPPTKETTFDWTPEKPGTYVFQVQAIDRDLNYSEPATLSLTIESDPVLVSLQTEVSYLRREVGQKYHFESIIGRSAAIRHVRALMERAIDSGLTVLITGETGTGKELVARAIHFNSSRKDHPLLDRNCGAIPRELLASDLFGHRKGTFTGANEDKMGLFEAASGGTVLLDEISEMPQDAQIHLLRVMEERKVRRLGENVSRDVDVRIIAMTNKDLIKEGKAGRFREDLYYRLSEFPIRIPPLRERTEDISLLAEHFLHEYSQEQKKELDGFAPGVFEALQSYSWPGNVRELRNFIRAAATLAEEGRQIQIYHFPTEVTQGESLVQEFMQTIGQKTTRYRELVDRFERRCIEHALGVCRGNRTQAAEMLGIDRRSLYEKMDRLGIDIPANISDPPENK